MYAHTVSYKIGQSARVIQNTRQYYLAYKIHHSHVICVFLWAKLRIHMYLLFIKKALPANQPPLGLRSQGPVFI